MELNTTQKRILYTLFALSGFCALIYEILWTKYLSLTFGTTMIAVSTVAATFMAGLALGSFIIGRFADQEANLLRIYAYLELGIALTALLFPPTLNLVEGGYVWLVHLFPDSPGITAACRIVASATLLLPPSICMGGTFPLMCRFFARKKSGGQIGRLYALNTLGATAGSFLSGFWLIPTLGLSTTGYLAAGVNLLVAAITALIAYKIGEGKVADISLATRPQQSLLLRQHTPLLISIAMIGFFSLAYEILWTRVFLLFLGNTSYAFSLMLSAYLIGIAGGGALYARLVKPQLREKNLFLLLSAMMGVSILITAPFYDRLAYLFQFAHEASGERWWHLSLLSYGIIFVVMAIPTILSGMLLPTAVAILDPGKNRTGEGVGLVVLCNTMGAVLGSLVAGYVMIPALGILTSFQTLALLNLWMAIFLAGHFSFWRPSRIALVGGALALLAFVAIPSSWNAQLMNCGIYCYAPKYTKMGGIDAVLSQEKTLKVIEGRDTTVAVHESLDGSMRFFTVNGKTDGGTGRDMATQLLVGHLPLLLHPHPDDVLVIGLGTGITLSGLDSHPVETIRCVEISPEVVEASDYFSKHNRNALANEKIALTIDDGRNLLLTNDTPYDVIISEPSNPWQTGNANLFTADFYNLADKRLKKNGIFCQWIGLYDITPDNLRIACNTFLKTFSHVMVFKAGTDMIMVGTQFDLNFDYQQMRQRMASAPLQALLRQIELTTPGDLIAQHYLFSQEPLIDLATGSGINTDDRPILEYSAKYNLGEHTLGEFQQRNMQMLMAEADKVYLPITNLGATPQQVAAALREVGAGYARAGRNNEAELFMRRAAEVITRAGSNAKIAREG